eukprot:Hpha_TRINITY_DN1352_c0_g1::TRINITY_DN1352_c0_g1_i1::g.93360::m.93360
MSDWLLDSDVVFGAASGDKFRDLTHTAMRAHGLHREGDFDDQQACHRVPNRQVYGAFSGTDDARIRDDLAGFNYSADNIFNSAHNGVHSDHERQLRGERPSSAAYHQKGDAVTTGLYRMRDNPQYARKSVGHLMSSISADGEGNCEVIASLDKRTFNSAAEKRAIDAARRKCGR